MNDSVVADDAADDPAMLPEGHVTTWWSTEPLGNYKSLSAVTAGPAAIVAAFSIGGVLSALSGDIEPLDVVSAVLFSFAALILFDLLMAAVDAGSLSTTPAERLDWFPEARRDDAVLQAMRYRQLDHFARFVYLSDRIDALYRIGLSFALSGLAAAMFARVDGSHIDFGSDDALEETLLIAGGSTVLLFTLMHTLRRGLFFSRSAADQARKGREKLHIQRVLSDPTISRDQLWDS